MSVKYDNGKPYLMWGEHRVEVDTSPITEKFYLEKAEKELRETPENIEKGLRELRRLIKEDQNLNVPHEDDKFLIKFLRPCKFYPDSAFKKLQNYYKFRNSFQNYNKDLRPSTVRVAIEQNNVSTLTPRDQHGRRIIMIDCAGDRWNHKEVPLTELFRGIQVCMETILLEERTQVSGVVILFDMKGLSMTQVLQFTPPFAKMFVDWLQDSLPARIKAIHVVNQPYVFNMLFAVFKPFFSEKIRSRLVFHGTDQAAVLAQVDEKAMRKRHGGTLPEPEIAGPELWQILNRYEDQFKVANSYGYPPKK